MPDCVIATPVGALLIREEDGAVCAVGFTQEAPRPPCTDLLTEAARQLNAYFDGTLTDFDLPLRLEGTPFQTRCWQALQTIPYGETISYGEQANRIGNPLPQRAGGGFNTGGIAVFRMAGGFRVQLTEVANIVNGHVVPAQVQQGILQHGTMPVGQHEAVTVGPGRVGRVMAEVIVPQHLSNICHTHGRTGVAGFGFLNRIHAQRANGVGEIVTGRH